MRVKTKSGVVPPSEGTTNGSRPKPFATAAFTRGTIGWSSGVREAGVRGGGVGCLLRRWVVLGWEAAGCGGRGGPAAAGNGRAERPSRGGGPPLRPAAAALPPARRAGRLRGGRAVGAGGGRAVEVA